MAIQTLLKDGRGNHKTKIKLKNRAIIQAWVKDNPGETMTQCMRDTKFSYKTVLLHLKAIEAGE